MSQILKTGEILGYFTLYLKKKWQRIQKMHYGYMYIQCSAHNMYESSTSAPDENQEE